MERLKAIGKALKSKLSTKSAKNARKNLIMSVVALVEVALITITAGYAWIESISSVIIKTSDDADSKTSIDTFTYTDANLVYTEDKAIDMGLYFREAGNAHLSDASSADGVNFVFPVSASVSTSGASWRQANVNDKNVNYIDYSFKVTSSNDIKLYFKQVPTIKADGEAITDNSVRFAITANNSTTVFSNNASTASVVSNISGATGAEDVKPFSDYTKDKENAAPVLQFSGGSNNVLVNVRMWLQNGDNSEAYAGKTITVEDFKLVPMSKTVNFRDLTTGHGENIASYVGNNGAELYLSANGTDYKMAKSSKDSTLWTAEVQAESLSGNYTFKRVDPKNKSTVWNKWETSETERSNTGSDTYTAIGSFESNDTGAKGYGTWGNVAKIVLDTEDTDVIGKSASNYVDMSVDGFQKIEMTYSSTESNWFGYVPDSANDVTFKYGSKTFSAPSRKTSEGVSTYKITSFSTGYWVPGATIKVVTEPASLGTNGAFATYVTNGKKYSEVHVTPGTEVSLGAIDMDDSTATTGYLFLGWYLDGNLKSENKSLNVTAGSENSTTTYTAKFVRGNKLTVKAQDMTTGMADYSGSLAKVSLTYKNQLGEDKSVALAKEVSANIPENHKAVTVGYGFTDSDVEQYYTTGLYSGATGGSVVAEAEDRQTPYTVNSSVTLYQRFEPVEISLSADKTDGATILTDDGNILEIKDTSNANVTAVKYGNVAVFKETSAEKYKFIGWYTDQACTNAVKNSTIDGTTYKSTDSEYRIKVDKNADLNDKSLKLYAKFELKKYNISAVANTDGTSKSDVGGNVKIGESGTAGAEVSTEVVHGDEVTLVATAKSGYEFIGWYNDESCTDIIDQAGATNVLQNVTAAKTYYALFKKQVAVTAKAMFNGQNVATGGKVQIDTSTSGAVATVTRHKNDTVALKATTESGYRFDGWFTDEACTQKVNDSYKNASLQIAVGDTAATYYAKFAVNKTVIYFADRDGYTNYYAYVYNKADENNKYSQDWHGTKLTKDSETGYYKFEFTTSDTGSFRVIVNDGGSKQYPANNQPGLEGTIGKMYMFGTDNELTELSAPPTPPVETTKKLYFNPSGNWKDENAVFTGYAWNSSTNEFEFIPFKPDSNGNYTAEVSSKYNMIKFVRYSSYITNWDNKWNESSNQTIPTDSKNMYSVTYIGDSGSWSTK